MAQRRVVFLGRYPSAEPHAVFKDMAARLAPAGIDIVVDNHWSDEYPDFDLIVLDEPIPDSDALLDSRILGQRTLNRRTRLDVAIAAGAAVAPFGGPENDADLDALGAEWGTATAVLKYDWSSRRRGVFLWPLDAARRKPFPQDFDPASDVFMAFQADDPRTYKVDAFGGVVIGGYVLQTHDMREPAWELIGEGDISRFDLPPPARRQVEAASAALLAYGAGYTSFDLMRSGDEFRIVEINTCGVGTSLWDRWPEAYAAAYARAILATVADVDRVPRYRALRSLARACGNDAQAITLPARSVDRPAQPAERAETDFAQTAFMRTLAETDRVSTPEMRAFIAEPLETLIRHAREQVPFYARHLDALFASDGAIDLAAWSSLPVLDRATLARARTQLLARQFPVAHGASQHMPTAGTEHAPLTVSTTRLATAVISCVHTRFYQWHGVPFGDAMAVIFKPQESPMPREARSWAPTWAADKLGEEKVLSSATPVDAQLAWLREQGPVWLNTRPSLAQQMALAVRERPDLRPHLRGILTSGEILTDDQRRLCREHLGHAPRDLYTLREAGAVALQCPRSDDYHVQSEVVLAEVLDATGRGCRKGEIGRLIVTPLYNFAMPLIRYDTGDFVVAGDRFDELAGQGRLCTCGRRLPRLQAIRGRARSQFAGLRSPPAISSERLHELTGARLWQLVEREPDEILLRLDSGDRENTHRDAGEAVAYVAGVLGQGYRVAAEWADLAEAAGAGRFDPFLRQGA